MRDTRDLRDLLQVLQNEERFLKSGGYDRPPLDRHEGPTLIFQDSPTCPNHGRFNRVVPCRECVLTELVPAKALREPIPCRHIPLNNAGETVEMLYKWRTLGEAKRILNGWLSRTILRVAEKRYITKKARIGPEYHQPDGT